MSRAKRKRKNAMKRRAAQRPGTLTLDEAKRAVDRAIVNLQPQLNAMAEQLVQQAIRNAAASQDDAADLAPMTDFEGTDDDETDEDTLAADRDDDAFPGENEDSDAWLEDEQMAYGDDWDGLGDGDDDRL
ncbi:hypothetical protein [Lacticaseibacillus kribbianus]|uniref:hypothetical protein n=1 Tax=Lacticaseibacillus kribbianus TaxID=2926292 RepID=UPI001CD3C87C|nr:hypothetical protein [Lacticaseibacillus kribbianus]